METIEELEAALDRYRAAYRSGSLTDAMFTRRMPSLEAADYAPHAFEALDVLKELAEPAEYQAQLRHVVAGLRATFPEILRAD